MSNDTFANLALELIVASPTNSRKNFDATKLQELADSIQASGVHQPVLVRPCPPAAWKKPATSPGAASH